MLRRIEGKVTHYHPIGVRRVRFGVQGDEREIDLNIEQPWVLRFGDHVVVVGEDDGRSGRFKAYAYRNDTREVFGKHDAGLWDAYLQVLAGIVFCWVVFPLFTYLPVGLRRLAEGRKVDQAASMIAPVDESRPRASRDQPSGRR